MRIRAFRRIGFRARLVSVMVAMLVVTAVITYFLNLRAERQIEDQVNADINVLIQAIDIAQSSLGSEEYLDDLVRKSKLEAQFEGHRVHVFVVNAENRIVDSSDANQIGQAIPLTQIANQPTALEDRIAESIGEWSSVTSRDRHTFIFPVDTTKGKYYLVVVRSMQYLNEVIRETFRRRLLVSIGIFGLAVIVAVGLAHHFTRPISALTQAVERVAAGQLDAHVAISRRDEIGELAKTFNSMIEQLRHQRELEEQLAQAERSSIVGRIASGIAHEIRNPLNYINLSIDHLGSKCQPEDLHLREQFSKLLSSVKKEITRLNRIVTDFLNYGRPAKLSPQTINIHALIEDTVEIVRQKAGDQNVQIRVNQREPVEEIRGDAEQLKSCFSNIIINAIQAMPQGGTLDIEIMGEVRGVRVNIRDTGIGISSDSLSRIFEPYYSTKEAGIGLGLAITKRIIEMHQGAVKVTSTRGKGTEFSIVLPSTLRTGDLTLDGRPAHVKSD